MQKLKTALVIVFLGNFLGAKCVDAQDVSAAPMLQVFEARWDVVEDRMVDIFSSGYGGLWLPPPARADSGGLSVGYDVFDRFDLGKPRDQTLYGTDTYFKQLVNVSHRAGLRVHTDLILNHNGFRDSSTPGFDAEGDYPGFVTSLPNDVDGDFHGRFETGEELFRLSGLIDIAQEKNHQFIRHPVAADPMNIPSGSIYDQPDPNNARFYPDMDLGGTQVWHPGLNQNVTLYDYNTTTPLAGDAVPDNATGLLMRNIRWMVQEMGVDGFRLDAGRHFPRWMLNFFDQAAFRAKQTTLLDGSPDHVFSFTETGYDSAAFLQDFIKKDIDNNNLGVVGGNRDALDFNLFGAMNNHLTANGLVNDWRVIAGASIDGNDDGYFDNGSQGVAFARSHDELGPYLEHVAHAYMLMRPGNAIVYFNAGQFGAGLRDFPRGGQDDALGGLYGEDITTLVEIRNTHGRGNYLPRTPAGDEKELMVYEREKSAVVALNNRLDGGIDQRTVQTSFDPGTPLVELTGNADNPLVDPNDVIPSVVVVAADGTIPVGIPRNVNVNGEEHRRGYVIYGVARPEGQMTLNDPNGSSLSVLAGGVPTAETNGTTRLNDIHVVTTDTFDLNVETNPVTLPGGIRDRHADGDLAQFRVDGGLDLNGNAMVDHVTPGSVSYGFEEFTHTNQPGFFEANGEGLYGQTIDATQLSEGMHFLTSRVYRHRDPNTTTGGDPMTAGDGGPAVFKDFRAAVYVDRLPPESDVESFEPFPDQPFETPRDLIVRSLDSTADSVHIFLNQPASRTDTDILNMAFAGQNQASEIDRDLFLYGFPLVPSGNNVATIVTFEITGNYSVKRVPGMFVLTERGLGLGDLNFSNSLSPADLSGSIGSFEDVLYSQNSKFNPAADINGDGRVENDDLFLLCGALVDNGADQATLDEYAAVLARRGDLDQSGATDAADIDFLFDQFGSSDWMFDLNADGTTDFDDVVVLVEDVFQTLLADANLDGVVDGQDFVAWNSFKFQNDGGWVNADFNGDGVTDGQDFIVWNNHKFQTGSGECSSANVAQVPESQSCVAWLMVCLLVALRRRGRNEAS